MPRAGYLTPSSYYDLMSNGRGTNEMGQSARKVVDRLVLDMLGYRDSLDGEYVPKSCLWGIENEWTALRVYEEQTLREVRNAQFMSSNTHPYIGGTMDGLVGEHGGVEVKCPYNPVEHLYNLLDGRQLKQYMYQIQGYLYIYELDWIDFISYDPRIPEQYQLAVHRVKRDEEMIAGIVGRCELAYKMACERVQEIKERLGMLF